MNLTGQKIQQVNSITHDGKVIIFGTALDGKIYYAVKRSGFEDTALREGAELFGFEPWLPLPLGVSVADPSVEAREQQTLIDKDRRWLLRSVYGSSPEVLTTIDAPVQLVSALGHVFVFRQAPTGKLLVNRFVLDGMTNQLQPKLEVRYARSKQRYEPQRAPGGSGAKVFDNLDYRDVDGKYFFEPAIELTFIGNVKNGWFTPLLVPTAESDRNRWHLFVQDAESEQLMLYSVGADANGNFILKDYLFGQPDPASADSILYRSIPGIIRRKIDLQRLRAAGGPSATPYDLQREQMTDTGPQLLRGVTRVMVALPVRKDGDRETKTAVLDFALAADGLLSQIDLAPDRSDMLRNDEHDVITPLSLLDDIKELAMVAPPSSGTVVATERGSEDRLQVRTREELPADVTKDGRIKIRGTQSHDGLYRVVGVDGTTFEVEASFQNNEAGFWEVVPKKQSGLVFDDMIVGTERTADGKLRVTCPSHDLKVGDEVQLTGTRSYNGIYPVAMVDAGRHSFVVAAPFFTGEAANLSKVTRRGLRMAVSDRIETPDLLLPSSSRKRNLGRTLSAWVRIEREEERPQNLIRDDGGLMQLAITAGGRVELSVQMSDGSLQRVTDPEPLSKGAWTHVSGSLDYAADACGDTRIALCRNGNEVAARIVPHELPSQFNNQLLPLDGSGSYIEVAEFLNPSAALTVAAWVYNPEKVWTGDGCLISKRDAFILHPISGKRELSFYVYTPDGWVPVTCEPSEVYGWHHYAATFDGSALCLFMDGRLCARRDLSIPIGSDGGPMTIGRDDGLDRYYRGTLVGVELWNRARSEGEIRADLGRRWSGREPGLVGYWPLDSGNAKDLSTAKRHGERRGQAHWRTVPHRHPQHAPPAAEPSTGAGVARLSGDRAYIEIPGLGTPTDAMTIAIWARSATPTWNAQGCMMCKRNSFMLHPFEGERRIQLSFWIDEQEIAVVHTPDDIERWHHYAGTFDGSTIRFYIDGQEVAQRSVSGRIWAAADWHLCLGHDSGYSAEVRSFAGLLAGAQVWRGARRADEIRDDMHRRPRADEPDLIGYWPLDKGPEDRSKGQHHGTLIGSPQFVALDSHHVIGGGFAGDLSEAQIWSIARTPGAVKSTMHLQLTGHEQGLVADYRLGALVYEQGRTTAPDFSSGERSAIVLGAPYAGARTLSRATASGKRVVKFGSEELVEVSQRCLYEERLEFRVLGASTGWEPSNADGTGQKLFSFSYWGKSSRGSDDIIRFPATQVSEQVYEKLGDGWYRAVCRVIVPDGVSLMRAFELGDVRGLWRNQEHAPGGEWRAIEVRKHRILRISNAITRDTYSDAPVLDGLTGPSSAAAGKLIEQRRGESQAACYLREIPLLTERLDVARSNALYIQEQHTLEASLAGLRAQVQSEERTRQGLRDDPFSFYQEFQVKHSGKFLTFRSGDKSVTTYSYFEESKRGAQQWQVLLMPDGFYRIRCREGGGSLTVNRSLNLAESALVSEMTCTDFRDNAMIPHQRWKIEGAPYSNHRYLLSALYDLSADVYGQRTEDGSAVVAYPKTEVTNQFWKLRSTNILTPEASAALKKSEDEQRRIEGQIAEVTARMEWLQALLAKGESAASVAALLEGAQQQLRRALEDSATHSRDAVAALPSVAPVALPTLALDERGLRTAGGLLEFASPAAGVKLSESCDGTVRLSFFEPQGALRAIAYDASADSRGSQASTFEKWQPVGARACAYLADEDAQIVLDQPLELPAAGWSCEAWIQYPLPSRPDGSPIPLQVVVSSQDGETALLAIRRGRRLGVLLLGWFFDSGFDLASALGPGNHHVAVTQRAGIATFYVDGSAVGSALLSQPALALDGRADCLEVPAHDSPKAGLTVSIWARSKTPAWNSSGCLVSKRDAFIMHPDAGSQRVTFHLLGLGEISFSPSDITIWHQYTATYDGHILQLYLDGERVAAANVEGPVHADGGAMYIGQDDGFSDRYFAGQLAEVAYFSSARGPLDIREDSYRPLKGDEPNLIGLWRMQSSDEKGAHRVRDLSKSGRHAVPRGAPGDASIDTQKPVTVQALGSAPGRGRQIGRLAEVRLFDVALTAAEVAVNARIELTGSEPGLVAYFPLDERPGERVRDRASPGRAGVQAQHVTTVGFTAMFGTPATKVLALPHWSDAYITCPPLPLEGQSFTIECWVRRSGAKYGTEQFVLSMGKLGRNQILHLGFRASHKFTFAFGNNDLNSPGRYTDCDWHHFCATYDRSSRVQRLYCDGVLVAERTSAEDLSASGPLHIGKFAPQSWFFAGDMAELRVWSRVRSIDEINRTMRARLCGDEEDLLTYYPLDEISASKQIWDKKIRDHKVVGLVGEVIGQARIETSTGLPLIGAGGVTTNEYSTVEITQAGRKQALMRRFVGYATGNEVVLLPEQRLEELTLQWVGNTQISPTLLGYIEGAPPVPSENLTQNLTGGYRGATSVTLKQSEDTSYSWQRGEGHAGSVNIDGFAGGAWSISAGIGVEEKVTEGSAGAVFGFSSSVTDEKDSTVSASSSLATRDTMALTGMVEDKPLSPALGRRWVPKNVGYALVVSGMADVFVTKLRRSGRMVSYEVRPVEGIPLDVNTITFMINPAYTLNGSLDGMVGSRPADTTFYPHVPEMRAQYGALYPASYFRLKDAYALKDAIQRQDKDRESFFYNFNAFDWYDAYLGGSGNQVGRYQATATPPVSSGKPASSSSAKKSDGKPAGNGQAAADGSAEADAVQKDSEAQKQAQEEESQQRKAEIEARSRNVENRVRAGAAFDSWQLRMADIQTRASKRNVVNTYVWDADGGLRAEEESFASAIEHSISTQIDLGGKLGASLDMMFLHFKASLSAVASYTNRRSTSKRLSLGKALELTVDLSGVESQGVTNLRDEPLKPGEKVDRYRFMTFYLEGSTDHFADFFGYVVDPVWLQSDDEEARALRMAMGKPNKCWRVLHRVTYVERPALLNLGQDPRARKS